MPEKYEREIDEIIKKTGSDFGPRTSLGDAFSDLQRRIRAQFRRFAPDALRVFTPIRLGALGVVLMLGAFIGRQSYIGILAILLLAAAYLISLVRGSADSEQRWRGQPVEARRPPTWFTSLKQWLGGRPRR